ncbi:hypothetical protein JSE7799_02863 [Jannaschia seosinensis]|uniref:Gamma-glutamylcyclotransferase AIG2-like domain-containing protein n=1 Tax=Jannaschia seosinensis TaxID=313367 RepID=A0A0M7BE19_9RHOB|nr:gamma-glutamylcyclotransferase family protein [Jannaschia seosinensis]CUH40133.1 hypothetical protein JSE7799_02863 [Jannaschia seosinensis]
MNRFFGYGSLVNRRTHAYPNLTRHTVTGWRRAWRHTPLQEAAFLTAVPDTASEIDGVTADVPGGDWAALDLREAAYVRTPLSDGTRIYHIPEKMHGPAPRTHPILLSYLDVVVQGFLTEFGATGVARFFDTTDGWDAPIRNDRDVPIYPRAQTLSLEEQAIVDENLARIGAIARVS